MSVESMSTDPYEVVLNDLRAKKAQIEQAISAIEAIRSGVPANGQQSSTSTGPANPSPDIDSPGAFLGMSIADAAKKLLAAKRQPMRNPDIAVAFKRGGLVLNSKDVVNTIGAVLNRRAQEVGDIVKVDRGTWGLKEWYPHTSFKKDAKDVGRSTSTDLQSEQSAETGTVASVAFMITQAMRDKLRQLGVTDDEIKNMSPAEAQQRIDYR